MLSAGHYPIVMFGPVHLPPILPASPTLYAILRKTHTILAFVLFAAFLCHLSTVLFHTLAIRDRLLHRMALWPAPSRCNKAKTSPADPIANPPPGATNAPTRPPASGKSGIPGPDSV
jgi:hypothetical protein